MIFQLSVFCTHVEGKDSGLMQLLRNFFSDVHPFDEIHKQDCIRDHNLQS